MEGEQRTRAGQAMTQKELNMNTGMLWFDNDPKTALTAKIERAADYYRHKYGRDPNLCLIHPSMLPTNDPVRSKDGNGSVQGEKMEDDKPKHGKITIRPYRPVLPGHLWIGIEDKN
jgi:hypothetical protein